MPSEPLWPTLDYAVETNRAVVADTGEPFALLDESRLANALDSPRNHWGYGEEDTVTLAVVLLLALARNHPFMQGNKRTAFAVALGFLESNGYELRMPDGEALADALVAALTGAMSELAFEQLVRPYVSRT